MNNGIVADGWFRLRKLKVGLRGKIEAKYAEELKAGESDAVLIRAKIEAEFQVECEKHSPSPYALFVK